MIICIRGLNPTKSLSDKSFQLLVGCSSSFFFRYYIFLIAQRFFETFARRGYNTRGYKPLGMSSSCSRNYILYLPTDRRDGYNTIGVFLLLLPKDLSSRGLTCIFRFLFYVTALQMKIEVTVKLKKKKDYNTKCRSPIP